VPTPDTRAIPPGERPWRAINRPHIKQRKEEAAKGNRSGYKARRWVVEPTHSWLNRFHKLPVIFDRRATLRDLSMEQPYATALHKNPEDVPT
jgi:hypothetical protein